MRCGPTLRLLIPPDPKQFDLGNWRTAVKADGTVALIGKEGFPVGWLRSLEDPVVTGPPPVGRALPDTG